jgi:hypothetical protein
VKTYNQNGPSRFSDYVRGNRHLDERGGEPVFTFEASGNYWKLRSWCRCVINMDHEPRAYDACPNCLGYGIMPIPLNELKK